MEAPLAVKLGRIRKQGIAIALWGAALCAIRTSRSPEAYRLLLQTRYAPECLCAGLTAVFFA
ncbi:hypothetical protein [Brasilonema bromeliae]|uniref:Uncharacterized protein n=1 Tax=Brasilonema bromeliae SPC951 TaxID=385972 RepID=A0ABX1P884_9CYAN|nr:hypothetical protein [Brasilonema bromeliae]NMG20141.1 hypothetical protein [Brasilonema bromeliae SPC951]